MSNNHLNIQTLFGAQTLKQKKEKEVFEKIVSRCHQKIKSCAEFKKYNCNFDIPNFMFGEIMYDFSRSRQYLIQRLKNEKFIVRECRSSPNRIYICWDYDSLLREHKHINLPKRDDIFDSRKITKDPDTSIQDPTHLSANHSRTTQPSRSINMNPNTSSEVGNTNTKKIIPYRPTGVF